MEERIPSKQGKKAKRGRPVPFASDKEGHYDIDGVSYAEIQRKVVVASDLLDPPMPKKKSKRRREDA